MLWANFRQKNLATLLSRARLALIPLIPPLVYAPPLWVFPAHAGVNVELDF